MNNKIVKFTKPNPICIELGYSIGSDYPLKGCSPAVPFSISSDNLKLWHFYLLTQFKLRSPKNLKPQVKNLTTILFKTEFDPKNLEPQVKNLTALLFKTQFDP
jgi:hypothetical protein